LKPEPITRPDSARPHPSNTPASPHPASRPTASDNGRTHFATRL
jgi:hypothetical protein